jgi:putative transposase
MIQLEYWLEGDWREVVRYDHDHDAPGGHDITEEGLTYIQESMDDGSYMNRRLHGWGFAKLHAQIRYKAVEKSIPIETLNPHNTSKECLW